MSVLVRRLARLTLQVLARNKSESVAFAHAFTGFCVRIARLFDSQTVPYLLRQFVSFSQPTDPLSAINAPPIDVLIACHPKDIDTLLLAVHGARKSIRNPIGRFHLVTPSYFRDELASLLPDCIVSSDEEVLGPELLNLIEDVVPPSRQGWIRQQAIKVKKSIMNESLATLVIDADTILLRPKTWLDETNRQILCISVEFNPPYKEHQRRFIGGQAFPFSFVTHHQLFKTELLLEVFGNQGVRLSEWITLGDFSKLSPMSEYDTYGEYLVTRKPSEFVFSKWNNLLCLSELTPETRDYVTMEQMYRDYDSVSFHSWVRS